MNHHAWKGGRKFNKEEGYWSLYLPDYFSADKGGYVRENVYIFQEYHKCCMLPWGDVHHKDFNKENNKISNLIGLMHSKHLSLHKLGKHKDTSDRRCYRCKSNKTNFKAPNLKSGNKTPYPRWQHLPWDKINWYCDRCYTNEKRYYKSISNSEEFINV